MAWQRGEPRVCAMTVPPNPSEEAFPAPSAAGVAWVGVGIGDSFDSEASQDVHSAGTTGTVNRTTRTA